MNTIKKIRMLFTHKNPEAQEIKEQTIKRSERAAEDWKKMDRKLRRMTSYKIAKATQNI